jgi:mRNA interferase RelE/StbE
MDRVEKYLRRLEKYERQRVQSVLEQLVCNELEKLDVKKLRGYDDIFRVRVGTTRVIYRKQGDDVRILDVAKRDERTYKGY